MARRFVLSTCIAPAGPAVMMTAGGQDRWMDGWIRTREAARSTSIGSQLFELLDYWTAVSVKIGSSVN